MNLLLIGAGQLGSRHLQSCLKLSHSLNIFVLDNAGESLDIARMRAQEITDSERHEVNYFKDINEIKETNFDFLIIATGATVRLKLLELALQHFRIKYAILEKVLFQDVESYSRATDLIHEHGIKVYVNCPLRTYPVFKHIKKEIAGKNNTVEIEYTGGEWAGLACNSIHYLDLMHFLSDKTVETIVNDGLDEGYIQSKRLGCIEFTGTLIANYVGGSRVRIETTRGSEADSTIIVSCGEKRWVIDELSGNYSVYDKEECVEESKYEVIYQSDLTHKMLSQINESGNCELISYEESAKIHEKFIEKLLTHLNRSLTEKTDTLPIT